MPVNFKNPTRYTTVADKPIRRTGYGTIANETKSAGENNSSAQRVLNVMPHYGIKGIKTKKT
jgi:hypothetical protein